MTTRGYFGIGIVNAKTSQNVGTLWRTAYQLGASFVYTVGARARPQCSDTYKSWRHVPRFEWAGPLDFAVPHACQLVAVEMGGEPLEGFEHPERACYVLGSEDGGLPGWALLRAVRTVSIPAVRAESYNVAVAGALVMYDRLAKERARGTRERGGATCKATT